MLQILEDYKGLEPGSSDSWNLVHDKWQLGYRLNVLTTLTRALEASGVRISTLKVADLGCGTGRSTRAYIDLGLHPEQLTGYDLRGEALQRARALNPSIRWDTYDGAALPRETNWISTMTLFSSIRAPGDRLELAHTIQDALPRGGHLFYYDSKLTRDFAGSERISPKALFAGLDTIWSRRIGRYDGLPWRDRLQGLVATNFRGSNTHPSVRDYLREVANPFDEAFLFRA